MSRFGDLMPHHMTVEEAESKKVGQKRLTQDIEQGKEAQKKAAEKAFEEEKKHGPSLKLEEGR